MIPRSTHLAALLLRVLPEREMLRENERESLIPEERDESEKASQIGLHVAMGNRVAALVSIHNLIGTPGIGNACRAASDHDGPG